MLLIKCHWCVLIYPITELLDSVLLHRHTFEVSIALDLLKVTRLLELLWATLVKQV